MTVPPYKLESTLKNHDQDVKAVLAINDNLIVSASRDKTVRSWSRVNANTFVQDKIYLGHEHFVNALTFIQPQEAYPQGLIVSSGSDKLIHVYALNRPDKPMYTLVGHAGNVVALATTPSGYLVSGSWDKKAIVWKDFQQAYILEGHAEAVWDVLAIDDDLILTASADATIRLWKNGKLAHVYQGHTQAVRGLALVPNVGFVSCSNDGSLRVWTLEGQCIQQLEGHTSFVYSVKVMDSGEFVSSGEDRTVRIWKDGQCIQTLQQPCISVWTVDILPNHDIVVGGSDAAVRLYTREAERMAPVQTQKEFEELLANQAIPSNQMEDINKEKLPGPEALKSPGQKEGQVIMIKTGTSVEAHQWSMQSQSWQKIGEVVGSSKSSKQTYEGQEYDYVFDIDVGAGPNGNLKLPYNVTQNPYDAAQKFLLKHDLPPSYVDQVTDFIIKNTEGVKLGSGYADPFTGANRYTPQAASPASSAGSYMDPFTGAGSYRPNTTTTSASASYSDPFTGAGSYRPAGNGTPSTPPTQPKLLPIKTYLALKQANPDAVLNKIRSVNTEIENSLSDDELTALTSIVSHLKTSSSQVKDVAGLQVIVKMVSQWPVLQRFPALDLVRLIVLHAPLELSSVTPQHDLLLFLKDYGGLSSNVAEPNETNAMLAYRALANVFQQEAGRQLLWEKREMVAEMMQVDVSGLYKSKNSRLAASTLAVNFAVLLCTKAEDEIGLGFTGTLIELLKDEQEDENVYRFLMALGTLVMYHLRLSMCLVYTELTMYSISDRCRNPMAAVR
ncbi:phospholipase A-2-activating protein [Mycotypha africana]|uniref:phospholipase A-2-activating protein n=1 Tax=Mycotypha africana TaxID=64632 RepID=UPI0023011775|nr:phospholipase A-2-activating protein [Mycotypha africana]KAI8968864.1 phospholipase A-2-activating protein [Mycotypha africana]